MMKKIVSLFVCLLMLITVFASCASEVTEQNPGAYIKMYISDPVYNFDPARAYNNESALKVISLIFDNLFVLGDGGKVTKSLAKDYEIVEDEKTSEYKMIITLNETYWSDGIALTANDVVYSWKRILDPSNSFDAASLLYDIKYAREAKIGEKSIDDVRIYALNATQVEIDFVEKIDYDAFLLKLTSYALVPLRENIVSQVENQYDWAKKTTLFAASGAFKLRECVYSEDAAGLVLERNDRYYRNIERDALDKYVKPYRLIVDYTMTDEEIKQAYENGELFYIGDIPLSLRGDWKDVAETYKQNTFSTHSYVLNHNTIVRYFDEDGFEELSDVKSLDAELVEGVDGDKLFANPIVRQALSLAINRDDIVNTVVFAEVATGLVPTGVFNTTSKKTSFRSEAGEALVKSDTAAASKLLTDNNIDASKYMFSISVAAYDEVHTAIAEKVKEAWTNLGFNVQICRIDTVDNKHIDNTTKGVITGIKDDIFAENYDAGKFQVAAIDYTAYSVDAFSVLAPFAKEFNGGAASSYESPKFKIPTHISGYDSKDFNQKILEAYNTTDVDKKAELLHDAEEILMNDMAIIPVVFNKTATLTNDDALSKYDVTYYNTPVFTKLKLKNWETYLPTETTASK